MFNKIALSLSLFALFNTTSIAEPIDISYNDEIVPVRGSFKIVRARNPDNLGLKWTTVRKLHRDQVESKIEFTLGDKSSLTCSINPSNNPTEFPPLQFSEAFLKDLKLGEVIHRNSKYLRQAILNSSVDTLLDETSKNTLYAFILERANEGRFRECDQITMEKLQSRLPGTISFKFFLYPPSQLFTAIDPVEGPYQLWSNADPAIRDEAMSALQFKPREGIVEYQPHTNGTLTVVSTY